CRRVCGQVNCSAQRSGDFPLHCGVILDFRPRDERGACGWLVKTSERPGGGAADKRLAVIQAADERRKGGGRRMVAQNDRRIAEDAAALGSPQRRVPKASAEGGIIHIKETGELDWIVFGQRLELSFARTVRVGIPRADFLAHVATEE